MVPIYSVPRQSDSNVQSGWQRTPKEEEAAEEFLVHVAIHFGGQKSASCSGPTTTADLAHIHTISIYVRFTTYSIGFVYVFFFFSGYGSIFSPTHQTRFYRRIQIISSNGLGRGLRCQNVPIIHLLAISCVLDSILFYLYVSTICVDRSIVCLGMRYLFWVSTWRRFVCCV